MYFCVLCIVCFVTFPVLFVCICVLNNCHRVATQLQLNIYHIIYLRDLCTYTGSSKKMDGILNRYNLKSTRRIYTFGVLKCSEKFKVLDLH